MSRTSPRPRDPRPLRRWRDSLRSGVTWGVAGAAITLLITGIARLAGVPMRVVPTPDVGLVELGPLTLVVATLVAAILAGALVGALGRLVRRPLPWILVGGAAVTVGSLSAPLGQPTEVPASTRVVLAACQCVTGLLVTYGLARGAVSDDRAAG